MKKVKVGAIGLDDMLKFKNLGKNRSKWIASGSTEDIQVDPVLKLSKAFHPGLQKVTITDIKEETYHAKTFVLTSEKPLAPFKAGQYISIKVPIEHNIYARPYAITSTKEEAKKGIYTITIVRVPNGIVSNYMLDQAKVGDELYISEPSGVFTYQALRDAYNIVGIAGGSGITPFYAMAKAIVEKEEDFKLTIFYGAKKEKDLLFKDEFDKLMTRSSKLKVIYVLSDETKTSYEKGFITKKLMDKYIPKEEKSFFICGPEGLYTFENEELKAYNLPKKNIRFDAYAPYLKLPRKETYDMTVIQKEKVLFLTCHSNETILMALERQGVLVKNKCRVGTCGLCRSQLLNGEVVMSNDKRRIADAKYNYIHPCVTYPRSNITIKIPD